MVQSGAPAFQLCFSREWKMETNVEDASTPLLHLQEAALDHVAAQGREAVEEEEAVAVIRLVKEAARGESFGLLLEDTPADVLRAQAYARGAAERRVNLTHGEAALLALLLALGGDDFGVGRDEPQPLAVHHEESQGQPDLRRGQADALIRVHRLEHIRDEPLQLRVEFLDRRADLLQNFFGILGNSQNGHAASLKDEGGRMKTDGETRRRGDGEIGMSRLSPRLPVAWSPRPLVHFVKTLFRNSTAAGSLVRPRRTKACLRISGLGCVLAMLVSRGTDSAAARRAIAVTACF